MPESAKAHPTQDPINVPGSRNFRAVPPRGPPGFRGKRNECGVEGPRRRQLVEEVLQVPRDGVAGPAVTSPVRYFSMMAGANGAATAPPPPPLRPANGLTQILAFSGRGEPDEPGVRLFRGDFCGGFPFPRDVDAGNSAPGHRSPASERDADHGPADGINSRRA